MKKIFFLLAFLIPATLFAQNYHLDSANNNNTLSHRTVQAGDSTYYATKYMVSIGTSITAGAATGYGNPYGSPPTFYGYMPFGFSYQLAQDVGMQEWTNGAYTNFSGQKIGNLGYPGATLVKSSTGDSSIVDRITTSHDVPYETSQIQLVVVEGGTNDATDSATITTSQYYSGVLQIYDTLVARGYSNNQILFVDAPLSGTSRNHRIQVLNAIMATVVDSVGAMFADVYAWEVNHGGFLNVYSDSLHPNNRGHWEMEQCILSSCPKLARVGRNQTYGDIVASNGFTFGSPWQWPNRWVLPTSTIEGTIVGDLAIAPAAGTQGWIHAGFGSTDDTTSTSFTFETLTTPPFKRTGAGKNTLMGFHAGGGPNSVSANNNTAMGYNALSGCGSCLANVAIGENAMVADTNGNNNTAVGVGALLFGASVGNNAAFGYLTLENNTSSGAVAVGYEALMTNTSGANNTAVGNFALNLNLTGAGNSAIGSLALQNNTGSNNTANGRQALGNITSGGGNVGIGQGAGLTPTTGSTNTYIGQQAGYQDANAFASTNSTSSIAIGAFAQVTQNLTAALGGNIASGFAIRGGIDIPNASSYWQLPAGLTTAGFSPLKFTLGSPFGALTTTALNGTGASMTVTYASQSYPPFVVGSKVIVAGTTSTGVTYNGTWTVTACTNTVVTITGTGTGSQTVAGTVQQVSLLTTLEAGAFEAYNENLYFTGLSAATRYQVAFTNQAQTFTSTQDFTGATITATTQSPGDNSTKVATTAFVTNAVGSNTGGIVLPTSSGSVNIASITIDSAVYIRGGNTVTVDGSVTITATSGGSVMSVYLSVPVNSLLSNGHALFGMTTNSSTMQADGIVKSDGTANKALLSFANPGSTSNVTYYYHYSYQVQ